MSSDKSAYQHQDRRLHEEARNGVAEPRLQLLQVAFPPGGGGEKVLHPLEIHPIESDEHLYRCPVGGLISPSGGMAITVWPEVKGARVTLRPRPGRVSSWRKSQRVPSANTRPT